MSKIQAKPFTEKVIGTLTDELKTTLVGLVNGSNQTPAFRSMINTTNYITGADKGKVQHIVLETWNKTYTGYLIYNDTYCVLIAYANNTQDLCIVNINLTNQTYTLVKEVLTILELRFILGAAGGSVGGDVTVDEINSGTATAGQVITANGTGGATWGDIPSELPATLGTAGQVLAVNQEGTAVEWASVVPATFVDWS